MATKNRKSVKNGNKKEVVMNYSEKPQNFENYFFCSSNNLEQEWRIFQDYVHRRYPVMRRVRKFIKILADDFQLKPQVVAYLEDCFRGHSPKMQISMFDTLHDYICYGDLVVIGVAHVDRLIKEMLSKIYNNK